MLRRALWRGCKRIQRWKATLASKLQPTDPSLQAFKAQGGNCIFHSVELPEGSAKGIAVCIHGAPGSVRDFRHVSPRLMNRGIAVVRCNLPGHAGSTPHQSFLPSPSAYAADMEQLLGHVREQHSGQLGSVPAAVVSHSLGGAVALQLLHRSVETRQAAMSGRTTPAPDSRAGGQASSTAGQQFQAGVFLSSVGLSPHRGIQPYQVVRALGQMLDWPLLGRALIAPGLRSIFVHMLGFPPSMTVAEAEVSHRRVVLVDFEEQRRAAAAIGASGRFPAGSLQCLYATDDHLMEVGVLEGLERALGAKGTQFSKGGHHAPVRTQHADATADAVLEAISSFR